MISQFLELFFPIANITLKRPVKLLQLKLIRNAGFGGLETI